MTMKRSVSSKNDEMPENASLISKNAHIHFKGPKGSKCSVILEAMNLIKLAQEYESSTLKFQFIAPSCPGASQLNYLSISNWHNKGMSKKILNSTKAKDGY